MPATRNIDPEITKTRGRLGVAVREGDKAAAEQYRQELRDLVIIAAAKRVAAQLAERPVSPETIERVRAALFGGA